MNEFQDFAFDSLLRRRRRRQICLIQFLFAFVSVFGFWSLGTGLTKPFREVAHEEPGNFK